MHKQEQVQAEQEPEHRATEQGQWVLAQTKHHKVQVHQHNKAEPAPGQAPVQHQVGEATQTVQLPKPEPVPRVQLMVLLQPPPEAGAHHQVAKAGHEEVQQVEPHQADQPPVPEPALVQTQCLQAAPHQVHRRAAAEHQTHHLAGNNNVSYLIQPQHQESFSRNQ